MPIKYRFLILLLFICFIFLYLNQSTSQETVCTEEKMSAKLLTKLQPFFYDPKLNRSGPNDWTIRRLPDWYKKDPIQWDSLPHLPHIKCVAAIPHYIIFEGDSLTEEPLIPVDERYPNQVKSMLNLSDNDIDNVALSGDTLKGDPSRREDDPLRPGMIELAGKVDAEFRPNYENIAVLWAGTNDLCGGVMPEELHELIQKWCKGRKDKGFKVIVCTITPRWNWCGGANGAFEERRLTVNELIRTHYSEYADGLADIAANHDIGDEGDEYDIRYYSDTVHMTSTGYKIVANIVKDSIIAIDPTIGLNPTPSRSSIICFGLAEDPNKPQFPGLSKNSPYWRVLG